jgi:UDP-N-acetylmuramyl tripeptide synthase
VVTSDNPRSEDPQAIIADVVGGIDSAHDIVVDRRQAVAQAISAARAGDVVLIAGKGHESYQEIAGRRMPYSDVVEAARALEGAR